MFVKTCPADLVDGFGVKTDESDEIEMLFEDHAVYAVVRELPAPASCRFWLFEIGAWDEENPNTITNRSTPFLPLGDDVDEAAKLAELMITSVGIDPNLPAWKRGNFKALGVELGSVLTGQKWTEYAEFGEVPVTNTREHRASIKKIRADGMEN